MWTRACIWIGGGLFSCLFIWAVAAVFCNGITPVQWDPELGAYVRAEGSVVRWRSEGWSDTRMGKHGLTASGESVLLGDRQKWILWGDSFADATQVDDSLRIANVYNALPGSMKAFTVAGGGLGVPDYYFNIPRYERLDEDIVGHVILLVGLEDIKPGHHVECHSRFLADPWRFEESACEPSSLSLQYAALAGRYHLEPLYELYRSVKDHRFRFAPGQVGGDEGKQATTPPEDLDQAWAFLVERLKAQTSGFVVFVYVPPVPALRDGTIVTRNPEAARKEQFKDICAARGVGFVDVSPAFLDLYRQDRRLPRGFFNAPPGGHLNEDGQRLIAHAIHEYFEGRAP